VAVKRGGDAQTSLPISGAANASDPLHLKSGNS